MTVTTSPEYRLIRLDYEIMQLDLPPLIKGEVTERVLKVELEPHVNCSFIHGRIRAKDGTLTNKCDLIAYQGNKEEDGSVPVVPEENTICVIESKTDLSVSALENEINEWIRDVRDVVDVPVFLAGVRHYNTRVELRDMSAADETVVWGTLREKGDPKAMVHTGELDRLITAVRHAEDEFSPG